MSKQAKSDSGSKGNEKNIFKFFISRSAKSQCSCHFWHKTFVFLISFDFQFFVLLEAMQWTLELLLFLVLKTQA